MSTVVLEFNLSDPDDREQYDILQRAEDMKIMLWDINNFLKQKIDYPDEGCSLEKQAAYKEIRGYFIDLLYDNSIRI